MLEVMRQYQANIMLVLSGICGMMVLFVYFTDYTSRARKLSLMLLESSAMILLIADHFAYIYRGDTSTLGWWMVRISNFLTFFLMLVVLFAFNHYLIDLYAHEGRLKSTPRRLKTVDILSWWAWCSSLSPSSPASTIPLMK